MNDMTRVKAERSVEAEQTQAKPPRGRAGQLFGIGVLLLLTAGLVFGAWRYYAQARETMADAAQRQSLVPTVRTLRSRPATPCCGFAAGARRLPRHRRYFCACQHYRQTQC